MKRDSADRPVLCSRDPGTAEKWDPPPYLRAIATRKILPNLTQLHAGDLLLFRSSTPSVVRNLICKWQASQEFDEFEASWHHAAIYLGIGFAVVEATGRGVRVNSLRDKLHQDILVRRHRFDGRQGKSILDAALAVWLGARYDFRKMLRMFLRGQYVGQWREEEKQKQNAVICSELFERSYALASRETLLDTKERIACPAYLCKTDKLQDVEVGWVCWD